MPDQVTHTDARELATFEGLETIGDKLREIWLNGRETNGKVADAWVRIAAVEAERMALDQRISVIERNWVKLAAVVSALIVIAGIAGPVIVVRFGG